jgi:hypothetical protein
MKGLRKLTTIMAVFAVLFAMRVVWFEVSELGLGSSLLMQGSFRIASPDSGTKVSDRFGLGLLANRYSNQEEDVFQTKADVENKKLDEGLELLRNTSSGRNIAEHLDKVRVKITFGQPKTSGAAAVFVPNFLGTSGKIIVSERLRDEETPVVAAILAHEGTHARMNSILGYDSVEQEYRCYMAQARVWKEARSALNLNLGKFQTEIAEASPENDYALEISGMKRSKAFQQIWKDYKQIGIDLPYE